MLHECVILQDLRGNQKQIPISSSAVRALNAFGNGMLGANSRPATPIPNFHMGSSDAGYFMSQKIGKLMADRQNIALKQAEVKSANEGSEESFLEADGLAHQNGRHSPYLEDQEVIPYNHDFSEKQPEKANS